MQYLELDSDILTGTSQWDSRSLSISDLPLSMKCLQINTYSHLSDLEFILRSLQSKISSSLDLLKVTFPCNRLINREYVDVIQEEDFWENGDPRVRADKGWSIIVTFSIQDYCLQFSCWKDDTSIADKIGRLVEQVKSAGIENLLEDYYADWIIAEGNQMNYIRESLWRDEEEGG
ncbi:hypothetical protein HII31_05499 [Pseudocercospora fuligena]|uniref:Uncharacterized protein n=1 Tax=Pseudocercospora fuligena TaxID=685502 RepID=A0A8H6RJU8_9PEZI|nr:hypothetical protein HII31_05499 [Pseudocercospora fuligena]